MPGTIAASASCPGSGRCTRARIFRFGVRGRAIARERDDRLSLDRRNPVPSFFASVDGPDLDPPVAINVDARLHHAPAYEVGVETETAILELEVAEQIRSRPRVE